MGIGESAVLLAVSANVTVIIETVAVIVHQCIVIRWPVHLRLLWLLIIIAWNKDLFSF
jgi:hypothetical protein